jgi:hypothetical protein
LRGVKFEVQIRSAFEHAWSVTTHALAYKADGIDWKRLRLAAQLKATVEQLDALVTGFDAIAEELAEHTWPDVAAMQHIEKTFRDLFSDNTLPKEVEPDSWSRFCENAWKIVLGAGGRHIRPGDKLPVAQSAMSTIADAARKNGSDNHPRSLSLVQFTLGTLAQAGTITGPIRNYVPLLTRELTDMFPKASLLGKGFQFQLPNPSD